MMISAISCGRRAAFSSHPSATSFTSASRRLRTPNHGRPISYISFSPADARSYTQLKPLQRSSPLLTFTTRSYSSSSPSSAQASHKAISETINPPSTTRPAILELPVSDPTADLSGKFQHYMAIARAYFTFYKTGLKNVYYNYRASLPLRQSLNLPLYIPTSPPGSSSKSSKKSITSLSRSDFQLLRRSAYDVRRMIPFTFILILCGEMTPLVVLALGNAICPLTCRVPKQLDKERIKRIGRKSMVTALTRGSTSTTEKEDLEMLMGYADPRNVGGLEGKDVAGAVAVFDLSPGFLPGWVVSGVLEGVYRQRLRRWVEYLVLDDGLIVKGGGVEGLSAEEVRIAVEERGGVSVGIGLGGEKEVVAEREWLKRWIGGRVKDGVV